MESIPVLLDEAAKIDRERHIAREMELEKSQQQDGDGFSSVEQAKRSLLSWSSRTDCLLDLIAMEGGGEKTDTLTERERNTTTFELSKFQL